MFGEMTSRRALTIASLLSVAVFAQAESTALASQPTSSPTTREADLANVKAAVQALQEWAKSDATLKPLAGAKVREASGDGPAHPRVLILSGQTPQEWDFPSKMRPYKVRDHGDISLWISTDHPRPDAWCPYIPPPGCWAGHTELHAADSNLMIVISTDTNDPKAHRRLVETVVAQFDKRGIRLKAPVAMQVDSYGSSLVSSAPDTQPASAPAEETRWPASGFLHAAYVEDGAAVVVMGDGTEVVVRPKVEALRKHRVPDAEKYASQLALKLRGPVKITPETTVGLRFEYAVALGDIADIQVRKARQAPRPVTQPASSPTSAENGQKVTPEFLLARGFVQVDGNKDWFELRHVKLKEAMARLGFTAAQLRPTVNQSSHSDTRTVRIRDLHFVVDSEMKDSQGRVIAKSLDDPEAVCTVSVCLFQVPAEKEKPKAASAPQK